MISLGVGLFLSSLYDKIAKSSDLVQIMFYSLTPLTLQPLRDKFYGIGNTYNPHKAASEFPLVARIF